MTYQVRMEGASQDLEATTMLGAIAEAQAWAAEGWEPESATQWVHCMVLAFDDDGNEVETRRVTATIEPREPQCQEGQQHDWQSPHWLGGCKETPGVWAHSGGVRIHEACIHCGCGKVTDTWAQDPQTGVEGLTSICYTPDEYSLILQEAE